MPDLAMQAIPENLDERVQPLYRARIKQTFVSVPIRTFGMNYRSVLSRFFVAICLCTAPFSAVAQQQRQPQQPPSPGPMLKDGTAEYDTPDFTLVLVRSSQTVAALKPKGAQNFDFTPGDLLQERSQDGYHHLG